MIFHNLYLINQLTIKNGFQLSVDRNFAFALVSHYYVL